MDPFCDGWGKELIPSSSGAASCPKISRDWLKRPEKPGQENFKPQKTGFPFRIPYPAPPTATGENRYFMLKYYTLPSSRKATKRLHLGADMEWYSNHCHSGLRPWREINSGHECFETFIDFSSDAFVPFFQFGAEMESEPLFMSQENKQKHWREKKTFL